MALPNAVEGGGHGNLTVNLLQDGVALDLTNATTITGKIYDKSTKTSRAIAGTLTVSGTATDGNILWTFAAGDLVAGSYLVQFTVNFSAGLPARNFAEPWTVEAGL